MSSLPPIWARDEPKGRGRQSPLSRAGIVRVAIEVADAEGIEAVSMRRLARELQAGAMSLYHYFENRDELLELMVDTVAGEMVVPALPKSWRPALEAVARRSRGMFHQHPWVLPILQGVPTVTPNLLRHIEQSARSVAALEGVRPELLSNIVNAVDDYTIGFTLRELDMQDRRERRSWDDPNVRYLLESGEFPLVAEFVASDSPLPAPDFELGLKWLLDGFEAEID
ncbi:TetR/AcrR family transcriptional regulator C-terminal domain-containing protein [Solirubrobacter sp. CPCC 204708]|uniref:TetR/AcrR family transcriptional regulator n=1 Tax=Solirubrobacter deserti TaxID=2282478 RepID=A0ABT4RS20_9ACTN|nr:TetR/AcrR family transcriptional regulator [Solirubrobacter deserti]MBE2314723.1 TetR/AcrR family transcriptional regulator C-terminal domain-containing protein [Solirubrobacter deserti]MDA0141040.1 TetR/AcrR family transcriptional regulator [Solirubrobacter deserti]